MATKNIAAFGIYSDQGTVNEAIESLKAAGFRHTDISVLFPGSLGSQDFAHEKHTKAPEGAVAAGGSGAVIGAAFGWLAGAGTLLIPGLEIMQIAGPVVSMLSGMGAGVVLGGFTGAIVGAGMPEYEAKRYEGPVRKGGILLSAHCDNPDWAKTARNILKSTGARDVATAGEARADYAQTERPLPRTRLDGHEVR